MEEFRDIVAEGPKVSMIVADCNLSCLLEVAEIFSLLKITPIPHKDEGKLTPGTITSASYGGVTRGMIKNRKPTYFKHSIGMDIICKDRKVNAKISTSGVHLCGITSEDMIEESMGYILDHIKEIQCLIDYVNRNTEDRDKTIFWLKEVTKSVRIKRFSRSIKKMGGKDVKLTTFEYDHYIRPISQEDLENVPNEKIAKFYLRMASDLVYHSDFCTLLDWARTIDKICEPNLTQIETLIRVKNSSSRLKTDIGICLKFAIKFMETFPEYRIFYDNAIKASTLLINIPYLTADGDDEDDIHTFLLQKSGSFTHSGPGGEENKRGYLKFVNAMRKMFEAYV